MDAGEAMDDNTAVLVAYYDGRPGAAEWAAAVAHHGGVEGLRAHVARWLDEVEACSPAYYGLLLRGVFAGLDYEALARRLTDLWPDVGEGDEEEQG